MNCVKCGVSCFDKPLYRQNQKGEAGVMMCRGCGNVTPGPIVSNICEIIVEENHRKYGKKEI